VVSPQTRGESTQLPVKTRTRGKGGGERWKQASRKKNKRFFLKEKGKQVLPTNGGGVWGRTGVKTIQSLGREGATKVKDSQRGGKKFWVRKYVVKIGTKRFAKCKNVTYCRNEVGKRKKKVSCEKTKRGEPKGKRGLQGNIKQGGKANAKGGTWGFMS